jgi:hypothetical protein
VLVNGNRTDVTGVELIQYNGFNGDDNLTVDFRAVNGTGTPVGTGVVDARVQNAATSGLEFNALITTAVNASTFTAATLAGLAGTPQQPQVGDTVQFNGETRTITAYTAGTGAITVNAAFSTAPAVGDTITIRTLAGVSIDEVLSNRLPDVRFSGVGSAPVAGSGFTLQGSVQPTTATFVPKQLSGASSYTFVSNNPGDTFVIEGNGSADVVTASSPAANTITVVTTGGAAVTATGMTATDLFNVNGLGGNDSLTINVTPGLILTPIFFDGGSGADVLTVDGTFDSGAGDITTVTYTPGTQPDRGRLQYTETVPAAQTMEINFENIEPVVDTTNADILTVNGNGAANSMTVAQDPNAATRALVSVDGFETMSFNNKNTLLVNGFAGDDTIVVAIAATAVITGLVAVRVNGDQGNDTIRLESVSNAVTSIIVNATAANANPLVPARPASGDGNDTIDASQLVAPAAAVLTLNGGAGNDVITGWSGNDTIDAGTGDDTIVVSSGTDTVDGGTGADTLKVQGNAAANNVTVTATNATTLTFAGNLVTGATTVAGLEEFRVELGDNNDTLTLDLPNAQLINAFPIFYDGGTGADRLIVQGAFGAATIDSVVYTPGLQPDEGRLLYNEAGQASMDVTFDNLEPIVDTTDAATLIVNGNGAENAMTVITDPDPTIPAGTVRALVTRDGFETMSFNNKTNLSLNGLSGDDTIVVDIATAPTATNNVLTSVTVNGDAGNDVIRYETLPATVTAGTINGGDGSDTIDASTIAATTVLTINGGAGNDTITGGFANDIISGGIGDDTLIDSPGNDTYNGDTGVDTLVIRGTDVNDILSFVQNAPVGAAGANYTVNIINGPLAAPPAAAVDQIVPTTGAAPSDPNNRPTIERILIDALGGDDAITVAHNDAYSDFTGTPPVENQTNGRQLQTIPVHVVGNSPNASDRLVVQDNGVGDLVIHREAPDRRSGSIVVGGMAPISYESTERVDIIPINNAGQTGTPPAGGRLLVFKDDTFETNESATNASPLGLEPAYIGQRNIDPGAVNLPPFGQIPGDEDWYEFRPQLKSTYRFDIFFEHIPTLPSGRPGLPEDGDLRLDVFRADGTLLGSSDISANTPINVDSIESVIVTLNPDITESVFIRVKGSFIATNPDVGAAIEDPSTAINIYDIAATEIDDEGPVVFDPDGPTNPLQAIFPNNDTDFDLFSPKPDNLLAGATPQIFSLTINLKDILPDPPGLPDPPFPGDPLTALDIQSALQPGIYRVAGDHVGIIDISSVELLNNFQVNGDVDAAPAPTTTSIRDAGLVGQNIPPLTGQQTLVGAFIQFTSGANSGQIRTITAYDPATGQISFNALPNVPAAGDDFTITSINHAQVRLNFREALPDDRFTLTILDSITDPGGNRLDGESDAPEPGVPTFPSGNGVPGGVFQARFTVDTRPELGAAVAQDIDIDINGNYVWDPSNGQIGNDATNVDLSFTLSIQNANGTQGIGGFGVNDLVFGGKFTNAGAGLPGRLYDQLGAYGFSAEGIPGVPGVGVQRWIIDLNGDGVVNASTDIIRQQPTLGAVFNVSGALPIVGNFDGNAANGDEIGLYNAGKWGLDTNRNFQIDAGEVFTGITGIPFVGDFDGDGQDDLATFNNNEFFFDFKANGFGFIDARIQYWGFPGVLDRPIAADIDQDGIDDVGLWVPRNSASLPQGVAEWYFLMSDVAMAPVTDKPELVTDNATTTSFFATNLIGADAATIQGKLIRFLSGANAGQVRTVTNFVPATGQVTFSGAVASAPLNGDIVSIGGVANSLETLNHSFSPFPLGNDLSAEFGDELALPLIGNFDPPSTPTILAPITGSPGDFDNSGGASNGDYGVWKANFGSTNSIANGNGDGKTDAADYVMWRKFFGPGFSGAPAAPGGSLEAGDAAAGDSAAAANSESQDSTFEVLPAVVHTFDVSSSLTEEVVASELTAASSVDSFEAAALSQAEAHKAQSSFAISTANLAADYRALTADRFFTAHMPAKLGVRGALNRFASDDDDNAYLIADLASRVIDRESKKFDELSKFEDGDGQPADDADFEFAALDEVFQTL